MEELWVVCIYMQKMELRYWCKYGDEKTRIIAVHALKEYSTTKVLLKIAMNRNVIISFTYIDSSSASSDSVTSWLSALLPLSLSPCPPLHSWPFSTQPSTLLSHDVSYP